MIERYTFISPEHYELEGVKDKFPHLVRYGDSYVVQYASPTDCNEMETLVQRFGLELIRHDTTTTQMVVNAIVEGMGNKVYNCSHEVTLEICSYFSLEEM